MHIQSSFKTGGGPKRPVWRKALGSKRHFGVRGSASKVQGNWATLCGLTFEVQIEWVIKQIQRPFFSPFSPFIGLSSSRRLLLSCCLILRLMTANRHEISIFWTRSKLRFWASFCVWLNVAWVPFRRPQNSVLKSEFSIYFLTTILTECCRYTTTAVCHCIPY